MIPEWSHSLEKILVLNKIIVKGTSKCYERQNPESLEIGYCFCSFADVRYTGIYD